VKCVAHGAGHSTPAAQKAIGGAAPAQAFEIIESAYIRTSCAPKKIVGIFEFNSARGRETVQASRNLCDLWMWVFGNKIQ
jgi:hypothetical protein